MVNGTRTTPDSDQRNEYSELFDKTTAEWRGPSRTFK